MQRNGDRRLTHTKFLWLKHPARLSAAMQCDLRRLRRNTLTAARAWALKEAFQHIWEYRSIPTARAFFWRWEAWARPSRLRPMVHVDGIVRRLLENILTYLTHRITDAVTEGLNARIQWGKESRGLRDRERFKLATYFHCGGLDLEPRPADL
jgi:transposase